RSLKSCRRALRDSSLEAEEVSAVVMVGGSTRVPRGREKGGEMFGRQPLTDIDPDQVVAIGAAIRAETLAGNNRDGAEPLLLGVMPVPLGRVTLGGRLGRGTPRSPPVPAARARAFTA